MTDRAAFLAERKIQRLYRAPYARTPKLVPRVEIKVSGPQGCGKTTLINVLSAVLKKLSISADITEVQE